MKKIYLVRHSGPFVDLKEDNDLKWEDLNKNMILSVQGEENAKELANLQALKEVSKVYSADSVRAIETIKYIAQENNTKIEVDKKLNERELGIEYKSELPNNFLKMQFEDESYKLRRGESLKEAKKRVTDEINNIIENLDEDENVALSMHCVSIMLYLSNFAKVGFNGGEFKVLYKHHLL